MASRWRCPPDSGPGVGVGLVEQAEQVEQVVGALLGLLAVHPGDERSERDVVERADPLDEVEELEDDADVPGAHPGEGVVAERGEVGAGDDDTTGVGALEPGDDAEERRLAATGGSGERDELAGIDDDVDAAQGAHRRRRGVEGAAHVVGFEHGHGRAVSVFGHGGVGGTGSSATGCPKRPVVPTWDRRSGTVIVCCMPAMKCGGPSSPPPWGMKQTR